MQANIWNQNFGEICDNDCLKKFVVYNYVYTN